MANHEQDQTARTGPPPPDADGDDRTAGVPRPGTDEGTFRWPSAGLPRLFGQPGEDPPGDDGTGLGGKDRAQFPPQPDGYPPPGWADAAGPGPGGDGAADPRPGWDSADPRPGWDSADPRPGWDSAAEPAPGWDGTAGPGPGWDGAADPTRGWDGAGDPGPGWDGAAGHAAGHGDAGAGDEEPAPVWLPPAEPPHQRRADTADTADSLTTDLLLPGRHAPPPPGWRRAVSRATGGLLHPRESAAELHRRELITRACTPVATGHHRVAVLSLKGGVGKTTTVVGLGSTLSSVRGDRVIAVDANPDRGTLSDKLRLETAATVRDLLDDRDQILRYADVRAFTTQAPSRLEVLASDRDPTVSVAFSDRDYQDVAQVLEHFYSVCITDCGTGLLHSAMAAVLRLADQIVLVSSPSVDGARSASATLDWLLAHGYGDLVRDAVVVLSVIRPRSKSTVDLGRLEQHFATRCRAVVRIPYDAHLEEGAQVNLAQLSSAAADAYLTLAAEVGDGFSWPRRAAQAT